jgi:hypothetical protein
MAEYTKVKITRIARSEKDKDGKELISLKNGKPYTKISLKTEQFGDKWLGGFGNTSNSLWKEGDTVDIQVTESNGYLNFNSPRTLLDKKFEKLEARLEKLENILIKKAEAGEIIEQVEEKPEGAVDPDEVVF